MKHEIEMAIFTLCSLEDCLCEAKRIGYTRAIEWHRAGTFNMWMADVVYWLRKLDADNQEIGIRFALEIEQEAREFFDTHRERVGKDYFLHKLAKAHRL